MIDGMIIKKTCITFEALVESNNHHQLSKLGIEVSMDGKISDSTSVLIHVDVQKISHIEPYWNNDTKCFVTIEGEHYLFNHAHQFVVSAINWALVSHSKIASPFAIFDWRDIQNEITKELFSRKR